MLRLIVLPFIVVAAAACAERADLSVARPLAQDPPIALEPCRPAEAQVDMRCGTAIVPENRGIATGRDLRLRIIIIPARSATPKPDPIFALAGGPGQTATDLTFLLERLPYRDEREVVVVDQRGTSGDQRLDCATSASAGSLQRYFEPMFVEAEFARCRAELETRADLTQYSTLHAVEDLESVRRRLGYGKINLLAVSYGTRLALMYMRRYPAAVRAAVLTGAAPPSLRNPLYHAASAQQALDSLLADCAADASCHGAFPLVRAELDSVAARLRRAPATVAVVDPASGDADTVQFDVNDLAEALRQLMYTANGARRIPLLVHQASRGDMAPIAEAALGPNRTTRDGLRFGMLMSVVCSEDVPRIAEGEIDAATRGTLFGDARVRQQMRACRSWPRAVVPSDYAEPFTVDVPTLIISGRRDPVTPRQRGDEMRQHLPVSMHVALPGGHGIVMGCAATMAGHLLRDGRVMDIDTGCIAAERFLEFALR